MLNKLLLAYLIRFKLYQSLLRLVGINPYGFGLIWCIQGRRRSIHRFGWQLTSVNQNLLTNYDENVRCWNLELRSCEVSLRCRLFDWWSIGPFVSPWQWEKTIDRTETESAISLDYSSPFSLSSLCFLDPSPLLSRSQFFAFSIPSISLDRIFAGAE